MERELTGRQANGASVHDTIRFVLSAKRPDAAMPAMG
jgi:hypothetical protein